MNGTKKIILSIALIGLVIGLGTLVIYQGNQGSQEKNSLYVYCGAGLREPMQEIAKKFEKKYGTEIHFNFAGSNTLLSQIELHKTGDVYMPGAKYYIDQADKKGFIGKSKLVVYHTPVIVVPEGNPDNVDSLEDLTKEEVNPVLGDPGACAIGKMGDKILKKNELLEEVEKNVLARTATVNELVVYVTQKQGDAAIIWKANVHGLENETDIVMISQEKNIIKKCPIGTLTFSDNKEMAQKFVDFVSTNGKDIFTEYGFIKYQK